MGFYIRKSISLGGGVRLNLSNGGLGISAGVKGLRFGANSRGTYIHAGRGGLYYRQHFSYGSRAPARSSSTPRQQTFQPISNDSISHREDLTRSIDLVSSSDGSEDIIKHFTPKRSAYWVSWLLGAAAFLALSSPAASAVWALLCVASVVIIRWRRARDVLVYDLEGEPLECYEKFVAEFESFFSSQKLWHYSARSFTHDAKRNAGVNWLAERKPANAFTDTAKRYRTNISAPSLSSKEEQIVFLPDAIVLVSGRKVAAFKYSDIQLASGELRFVEHEQVPNDATLVGRTWQYTNKKGGPDLRFKNNRELPICLYQQIGIGIADTVARVFAKSNVTNYASFAQSVDKLRSAFSDLKESAPPMLPSPAS